MHRNKIRLIAIMAIPAVVFAAATAAQSAANMLLNGGFESPQVAGNTQARPDSWNVFSHEPNGAKMALASDTAREGKQSLRFVSSGIADSYQGIVQSTQITEGTLYKLSVFVRNDPASPLKGTSRGQISLEWKDATGAEVDRTWGPDWGAIAGDEWKEFKMTGKAPSRAVQGWAVITVHEGKEPGGGAFYADDMVMSEASAGE